MSQVIETFFFSRLLWEFMAVGLVLGLLYGRHLEHKAGKPSLAQQALDWYRERNTPHSFYVSDGGDDQNDGLTIATSFRTLGAAQRAVRKGRKDKIYIITNK